MVPVRDPLGIIWALVAFMLCGVLTLGVAVEQGDLGEIRDMAGDEGAATSANADVLFVRAVQNAAGTWTFSVTVAHPDTGWEDYADG